MTAGLQCFNAAGQLTLEISDRVYRTLAVFLVPTTNLGSVVYDGLTTGTPKLLAISATQGKVAPTLTVVGNTLSWDHGSTPSGNRDANLRVMVMVY